jgi:hypothetical protein
MSSGIPLHMPRTPEPSVNTWSVTWKRTCLTNRPCQISNGRWKQWRNKHITTIRSSTLVLTEQGKRKRLRDDLKCTTNIPEKTRISFVLFSLKNPVGGKSIRSYAITKHTKGTQLYFFFGGGGPFMTFTWMSNPIRLSRLTVYYSCFEFRVI